LRDGVAGDAAMADATRAQLRGEKGRRSETRQKNVLKDVIEARAASLLYLSYDCNEQEIAEEIRTVACSLLELVNTRGAIKGAPKSE
jgi:hypothetical protein